MSRGSRRRRPRWCAGSRSHDPGVRIAGVVLNRVGSERHRVLVRDAIEALGIPVARRGAARCGAGHAGTPSRAGAGGRACRSRGPARSPRRHGGSAISISTASSPARRRSALAAPSHAPALPPPGQRIALAADAAFTFVYPHLLDGWRRAGAEIVDVLAARRRAAAARAATPAGCPAAIRSFTPARWRTPVVSATACGDLARPARSTANAAATWCWAKASRTPKGCAMP